uniref:Methyltransferase n=1 Tax=Ignisphaera aggregans TaxID=334771 RepID=A0A7C2VM94_9CREN
MNCYKFRYIEGIVLTWWNAQEIIGAARKGLNRIEIVADLGLRRTLVEIRGTYVIINGDQFDIEILENFREGFAYKIVEGGIRRLDTYSDGSYYKIRPVAPNVAPTIEINGIHMHRIQGVDPWRDALAKVKSAGKKIWGADVLDICTGLGYTAIAGLALGARTVTTIEVDRNVLFLASHNPWSKGLEDPRIRIVVGDAFNVLDYLEAESYGVVVHDPPRFEVAGDLYSLSFYKKIYRVLRRGGVLVHYTGTPGRHSNIDILKGIKSRLAKAGFDDIRWIDEIQGFKAYKIV